jgi:hypothetical protein
MREANSFAEVFACTYNSVLCDMIFDVSSTPYKLSFINRKLVTTLRVGIVPGYKMDLHEEAKRIEVLHFFNIGKSHKGKFHFSDFVASVNKHIPAHVTGKTDQNRDFIYRNSDIEDADQIYYFGIKHWQVNGRSDRNRLKTELLFPQLNVVIGDRNISVCYIDDPDKAMQINIRAI